MYFLNTWHLLFGKLSHSDKGVTYLVISVIIIHTSNVLLNWSEIGVIGGLNIVLASIEAKCGGVGVFVSLPRID